MSCCLCGSRDEVRGVPRARAARAERGGIGNPEEASGNPTRRSRVEAAGAREHAERADAEGDRDVPRGRRAWFRTVFAPRARSVRRVKWRGARRRQAKTLDGETGNAGSAPLDERRRFFCAFSAFSLFVKIFFLDRGATMVAERRTSRRTWPHRARRVAPFGGSDPPAAGFRDQPPPRSPRRLLARRRSTSSPFSSRTPRTPRTSLGARSRTSTSPCCAWTGARC